jgi:hypothetical protein
MTLLEKLKQPTETDGGRDAYGEQRESAGEKRLGRVLKRSTLTALNQTVPLGTVLEAKETIEGAIAGKRAPSGWNPAQVARDWRGHRVALRAVAPVVERIRGAAGDEVSRIDAAIRDARVASGSAGVRFSDEGGMERAAPEPAEVQALKERRAAAVADALTREALAYHEAGVKAPMSYEWRRRMADGGVADLVSYGIAGLMKMARLHQLEKWRDEGRELPLAAQAELDLYHADQQLMQDVGMSMSAGVTTGIAEMVPYMGKMRVTQPGVKALQRATGLRKGIAAAKLGHKQAAGRLSRAGLKVVEGAVRLGAASVGAAARMLVDPATYAGVIERQLPTFETRAEGDAFRSVFADEGQGAGEAWYNGMAEGFASYLGEVSGDAAMAPFKKLDTAARGRLMKLALARRVGKLDGPVRRVASLDTWVAYAPRLEEAILPQTGDVLKGILELAEY